MPESNFDNKLEINASPTKELFIYMLTRDIPLSRSILDLVDNSMDGILRTSPTADHSKYWIKLTLNSESFVIEDNCGGIPVNIARNYAFRFGRPHDADSTPGSIGKFGVGMKRTFFKIGNNFEVVSRTNNSFFSIEQDVVEWLNDPANWHFTFKKLEEEISQSKEKVRGTTIKLTSLHDTVSKSFSSEVFISKLMIELRAAYIINLERNLKISVNGIPIEYVGISILESNSMKPVHTMAEYRETYDPPIIVNIFAGLGERSLSEGGWYIFCNDRMVLKADQGELTGWGEDDIPKYHTDFAFFRGYVFFHSEDGEQLPWTTTKTGVDIDSPLYRAIRQEMSIILKPILKFLRKLGEERLIKEKEESDPGPLESSYNVAQPKELADISISKTFKSPQPEIAVNIPTIGRIQYLKSLDKLDVVKKHLKVRSNKKAGEKTFDYYYEMECSD